MFYLYLLKNRKYKQIYSNATKELKRYTQNNFKNSAGFTLIELIVSIFIVVLTLGGVYAVFTQIIQETSKLPDQLIANYLAQEGMEIVRNIRDTNWLSKNPWDQNLTGCASSTGGCEGDYNSSTLSGYSDSYLYVDSNGFYNQQGNGTESPFKRKIVINDKIDGSGNEYLEVKVYVFWQERGKPYAELDENLYNWGP